jgi:hypothetical protein
MHTGLSSSLVVRSFAKVEEESSLLSLGPTSHPKLGNREIA